jgi:hypothetical protein
MSSSSDRPNIYTMSSFQTLPLEALLSCPQSAQQHKFRQKYDEAFYWVEQQHGFAGKFVSLVRMWGKCSLQEINIYC